MGSRILFSAAFGGLAPTLLKAVIASQNSGFRPSLIFADPMTAIDVVGGFLFVILIMGALGAGIAYAFQESDMKKAFFIGLGVPSLLTVGSVTASQPPPVGTQLEQSQSRRLGITAVVHAAQRSNTQQRAILFKFPDGLKVTEFLAIFAVEDREDVARTFKVGEAVGVPVNATTVELDSSVYFSEKIIIPRNAPSEIVINLRTERNRWYGVWSAMGVRSRPIRLVPVRK
jgi:hypothetical protein